VARFLRDTKLSGPVRVFAVGKAASAMARGALDELGSGIERMLVITKEGHADPALDGPRVVQLEGPHPVPDARSLAHGQALEAAVCEASAALPLFLVSGGSSSLVESLREGVTLEDLRALNSRGLAAGWDIGTLNTERAHLSRIKAGGISRLLGDRTAIALFISDVPGDDPEVIGSGLLGHGSHPDRIERHVVASVDTAVRATVGSAQSRGLRLEAQSRRFDGDADAVARAFVEALRGSSSDGLVWGGESTVKLPARFGHGGRNTHLALCMARLLNAGEPLTILAAGTDGTDGATSDAGAIIDAGTLERAELAGCDAERAWQEFDSGTALEYAADLVHTGPTGTNVGDLLIGIRRPASPARGLGSGRML
jgi:glycerate 2-kinase